MRHPRWMHYHDAWRYDQSMNLSLEIDPNGIATLLGGYASIGRWEVARWLKNDDDLDGLYADLMKAMKNEPFE